MSRAHDPNIRNRKQGTANSACELGRHSPRAEVTVDDLGNLRTTCRHCGASLLRTANSLKWILSGRLG
jgi:hypothetical protein